MSWNKHTMTTLDRLGTLFGDILGEGQKKDDKNLPDVEKSLPADRENRINTAYALASFLGYVARADDHFDETECKRIHDICFPLYPRSAEVKSRPPAEIWSENLYEAMKNTNLADAVIRVAQNDREARDAFLVYAWRIAASDGKVTENEVEWVSKVAVDMGASLFEVEWSARPYHRIQQSGEDRTQAAKMLGVAADDSPEAVKQAYRKACDETYRKRPGKYDEKERNRQAKRYTEIYTAYKQLQIDLSNPPLFGLAPEATLPRSADTLSKASCFICETVCDLPEPAKHREARCPLCQALLLFTEEIADSLLRYEPPGLDSLPAID